MPEKILELLEKESLTKEQIGQRLDLSVDEVDACLDYLRQAGFIRSENIQPTGAGCSGNCGNCGSCGSKCSSCGNGSYKNKDSDCDSGLDCYTKSNSGYILWEII